MYDATGGVYIIVLLSKMFLTYTSSLSNIYWKPLSDGFKHLIHIHSSNDYTQLVDHSMSANPLSSILWLSNDKLEKNDF